MRINFVKLPAVAAAVLTAMALPSCSMLASKQGDTMPALAKAYKGINDHNPILTHDFGADPWALVYGGRVYIYMTGDTLSFEPDGSAKTNTYGNINTLRVVSSADLVNWTAHETIKVAGREGTAKWASCSWAPAVAYKNIGGKDTFFLYFSNSGGGVGVLQGESPLGPWTDPLGRSLVNQRTPNCQDIPWVFDPAVLVDDDGRGYLYFGGGIPEGKQADPGSARVVPLGDDMISLAGDPVRIPAPFFFEDSGINKINGKYIYSYCTNWHVTDTAKREMRIDNAVIAVMSGSSPMGPFTLDGSIFRNPGIFFGYYGNNHHALFEFEGQWYLAYHSQLLEAMMNFDGKGYRATHIDAVQINDGRIEPVTGTRKGVAQVGHLDPFVMRKGAESGISAELSFGSEQPGGTSQPIEYAAITKDGSWLGIYGADFGNAGAKSAEILVRPGQRSGSSTVEIRLGSPGGDPIGSFSIPLRTREDGFASYTTELEPITGVHDVFFVFSGSSFDFGGWQFNR